MKKYLFLLFILSFSFSLFAQRNNFMLLRNLENGKRFKLMYEMKYAVKLKPDFVNTLPNPLKDLHVENESIHLKLVNANYDTLFFQNGIAIPYRFIESMSERDISFYTNIVIIGADLVGFGFLNYYLFQQNSGLVEIVLLNVFTGIAPLGIVLPISFAKNYIILNQYGIESLENKDIFKKKPKTIFDK